MVLLIVIPFLERARPYIGDKGSQTHDEEGNQRVALAFVWLYRELSVLGCPRSLWGLPSPIITTRYLCNLVPDSVCLFYTFSNMGNKAAYKEIRPPIRSALFISFPLEYQSNQAHKRLLGECQGILKTYL